MTSNSYEELYGDRGIFGTPYTRVSTYHVSQLYKKKINIALSRTSLRSNISFAPFKLHVLHFPISSSTPLHLLFFFSSNYALAFVCFCSDSKRIRERVDERLKPMTISGPRLILSIEIAKRRLPVRNRASTRSD